ncbi:MAG: alpha-amylase/4-alpha-glucanotransferase domain-containing protein [Elainella sp.]
MVTAKDRQQPEQSQVNQLQTPITLENATLRLRLRPDLGGRIDQFLHLPSGRDWVWHPPTYDLTADPTTDPTATRELEIGTGFDDHWQGGWDEVFPNDMAQTFEGRSLVDHGELWSQPWQVKQQSPLEVTLRYDCQTVPVTVEKTIRLAASQPAVQIEYHLQNHSATVIPFLLKLHAALAIQEGDQIDLPDCQIQPVTLDFSKIIGRDQITPFPQALAADGSAVDLRPIPPRISQLQEFYYALNLTSGSCGIRDPQGNSLQMQFDTADFPYVWLFQSYGGWHDHYVLVMEPCTTLPYDLEAAVRNHTAALLPPHAHQHRSLTIQLTP